MPLYTEDQLEQQALALLADMGWACHYGPHLAPDAAQPERSRWEDALLPGQLAYALGVLNPTLPQSALDEAAARVTQLAHGPDVLANNLTLYRYLIEQGVPVQYKNAEGHTVNDLVQLIDFDQPGRNSCWAVSQFTLKPKDPPNRRPDIILFVNGLPLVVIELKNPANEEADTEAAYHQLQTYKALLSQLFSYNALMVASDGFFARAGTLSADFERFMPWKTVDAQPVPDKVMPQLEVMIRGMLRPDVLLRLVRHYTVFEQGEGRTLKKLATYHQYNAVEKATERTRAAVAPGAEGRCGVVWHTQGSGKSLTMVFYAGKMAVDAPLGNPTLVVLTDRADLDGQLHETFSKCKLLLRQEPAKAESRRHLRQLLQVASGGIVFTTIQKFLPFEDEDQYPCLSERQNIIVIADEAHRTQYGFLDGLARHMRDALPHAAFIGFTGTPIEKDDRNTQAVFGEYIDIYDLQQAVEDGATVKIYYESRLVRIALREGMQEQLDTLIAEYVDDADLTASQRAIAKHANLESIIGDPGRIHRIAEDIVQHYGQRVATLPGKGMIVCYSRRLCVELYEAMVAMRPDWHSPDDTQGVLKVVMTGSAKDPVHWQPHARNKEGNDRIATRLKNPQDPLQLVIVCDMWLTGFDAPVLHTLYVDKPMKGHNLAQAIARVNRVYGKDKTGGLVVDYIGIAQDLKQVLLTYAASGGRGRPTFDQEEAVGEMLKRYEIVCQLFAEQQPAFDYQAYFQQDKAGKLRFVIQMADYLLNPALTNGRQRFLQFTTELLKAFALSVPHPQALAIRDEVGLFQYVMTYLRKLGEKDKKYTDRQVDTAIRQIVSAALVTQEIVDVFATAGLQKPEVSILSEEFLAEVQGMTARNLAAELLQRLLADEIKLRFATNLVQSRKFSEMLQEAVKRYQNNLITTAQVIEELIQLARGVDAAQRRGEQLGLNEAEMAFYDALATSESAVAVLGDEILKAIAHDLAEHIRRNASIDWSIKENVRAKMRVLVKRILKRYDYPPDKQAAATELILQQSERLFE
ncbi:MAG: type I restriction endonuclease subunit R [Sphingobacteriia bacterium]|jgi:type I restriction enzyme R subunit